MIKKLRKKFIAVTMLSVFIVLAIIMGAINIMNYNDIIERSDDTLKLLSENGGVMPGNEGSAPPAKPSDDGDGHGSPSGSGRTKAFRNKEMPFDTRYFTVTFDKDGKITASNVDRIASISESTAKKYAKQVVYSGKENGNKSTFRFLVKDNDDGKMVIFVNQYRDLENFRSFLLISILVSIAGLIAVLLLVIVLSGYVVKPIAESYEKQKRFITDAGHELKTPLTVIDADVKVMEMESGKSEWTDDIKEQTKRLAGLTNELIFLSKMDEGRKPEMIDFPASDVFEDTVKGFASLAKVGDKEIRPEIESGVSYNGDEKMIRELMSILIDNAVKYSDEKDTITAGLKRAGKGIDIYTVNRASGITRDDASHMFDRFYRADSSRSDEVRGYGLGLSMAKAVCEAHSGSIDAELIGDGRIEIRASLR